MNTRRGPTHLIWAFVVAVSLAVPAQAQELLIPGRVLVVNMIDAAKQNDEILRDSEPNLAVNPNNPLQMAASAFTPDPLGGPNAPIYISIDGGRSWKLCAKLPFNYPITGTGDITLRFGTTSDMLYVAALKKTDTGLPPPAPQVKYALRILRDKNLACDEPMEILSQYGTVDQPHVQAISVPVAGGTFEDRVYVGYSDIDGALSGESAAAIQVVRNANTVSSASFVRKFIERRTPCGDGPTRPAVHSDGTIYAAFFSWTLGCGTDKLTADIVVVRDDNWGDSSNDLNAFERLTGSDGKPGQIVKTGRTVPWTNISDSASPRLGKQRLGGQISIAVDPSNSDRVYVAWADGYPPDNYTIHVQRSIDRGKTWDGDLITVTNATNPSLAINSRGKVGFLYQKLVAGPPCSAPEGCWETHFVRSDDEFASPPLDLVLHRGPDDRIGNDNAGPLGEYNHLMAIGTDFYGIFSGHNSPHMDNFPQGRMPYKRKAESPPEFATARLIANDGTEVPFSVDPFFFHVSEPIVLDRCFKQPWLCDFNPKMERGLLKLQCLIHGCTVIDFLPKNCPLKFNCPGCARGGMCPPYYHIHLDGLKGEWRAGLLDLEGKPVAHRQFKTQRGIVVSFRPSKGRFISGKIGSYLLAFEMGLNGKAGTEYRVKARLTRSDRHYEVGIDQVAKRPR